MATKRKPKIRTITNDRIDFLWEIDEYHATYGFDGDCECCVEKAKNGEIAPYILILSVDGKPIDSLGGIWLPTDGSRNAEDQAQQFEIEMLENNNIDIVSA